jgi:hypothetical protein
MTILVIFHLGQSSNESCREDPMKTGEFDILIKGLRRLGSLIIQKYEEKGRRALADVTRRWHQNGIEKFGAKNTLPSTEKTKRTAQNNLYDRRHR